MALRRFLSFLPYRWGSWPELDHRYGVMPTRETLKSGARSNQSNGSYAFAYRPDMMRSFGPLTKAIDTLFNIIVQKRRLQPAAGIFATTTFNDDELFPYKPFLCTHWVPHRQR
ncbi:MAG: hypothetical protein M1813_007707 [Trichoglossum hirsutum]|nr:MAG: hypothetical protein M1813_007707 [Trichoglossum hirsutum]